jgi:hypothetical protein
MGWALIRRYLAIAAPVPRQWGERAEVDSLRSITTDDVQDALKSRTGSAVHNLQTVLRSLFRALKRERLIFRDPTRGITVTRASKLPRPLPSDRLRGLLDRTPPLWRSSPSRWSPSTRSVLSSSDTSIWPTSTWPGPAHRVGCVNAFMQLAGTRAADRRVGHAGAPGLGDPRR